MVEMNSMNQYQRSMQIWSMLVFAAKHHKIVSYENISKLIGVPTPGVGRFLFLILRYCAQNNLPPLTSIVISHVTGRPGDGFPEDMDIIESQSRTFVYDWLSRQVPNSDDFQSADPNNA